MSKDDWGARLKGRCPSCGSDTLFRGSQGYITCSLIGCKNPGAAHDLLSAALHGSEAGPQEAREDIDWYDVCDKAWTALDGTVLAEPDASLPAAVLKLRERAEQAEEALEALEAAAPPAPTAEPERPLAERNYLWILEHQILPNQYGLKRVALLRAIEVLKAAPPERVSEGKDK